jgi:hypothetical protein
MLSAANGNYIQQVTGRREYEPEADERMHSKHASDNASSDGMPE